MYKIKKRREVNNDMTEEVGIPDIVMYQCPECGSYMEVKASHITARCPCCGLKYVVEEVFMEYLEPEDTLFLTSFELFGTRKYPEQRWSNL